MVAVGMALIWAGYSTSLWGWCLLRGYNVTMGQLLSPAHPYGTGKGQGWPPGPIPDTRVWPDGAPGGSGVTPADILGQNVVSPQTAQQIQQAAQNAVQGQVFPTPSGEPPATSQLTGSA